MVKECVIAAECVNVHRSEIRPLQATETKQV